jgi:tetratricopeptide (TPR) repeat protein
MRRFMPPSLPLPVRWPARILLPAALLVLGGWLIFAPGLRGGWLWDDGEEITQNAVLRDPGGLAKIWLAPAGADYLPVKTTVQWIGWRLWGDSPVGFHALSLGLHVLSALLFWRLLDRLGLRLAWLGGLLFVVHPLAVESVAWMAELKNPLSLAFLLGAMLAYLEFDAAGPARASAYVRSLLCFLLALLSKASVVMFPVVLLLYCWWRRRRIAPRDLAASAPFFAVSLGLGLVTVWFQSHRAMLPGAGLAPGVLSPVPAAGLALLFYCQKAVWPFGLLPIYPAWSFASLSLLSLLPWLALGLLTAALASCRAGGGPASRAVWFGFGFFAVNLLPVLGLVPMAYQDVAPVADHFAYLPLLGVIGLATAALGGADAAAARAGPSARLALAATLALGVGALTLHSRHYAAHFRDAESLWSFARARNPESWAVRYNLANALGARGDLAGAAAEYREALRLKPASAESAFNLALALSQLGRPAEAVGYFEQARRGLAPVQQPVADYRLGNALLQLDRASEAVACYEEALRIDPRYAPAESNLGAVLGQLGRSSEALVHLERAAQLDPADAGAQNNLANALFLAGRLPAAIARYERALQLRPGFAEARTNLELARRALAGR